MDDESCSLIKVERNQGEKKYRNTYTHTRKPNPKKKKNQKQQKENIKQYYRLVG